MPVLVIGGTGMHGGEIVLRCQTLPDNLPEQAAILAEAFYILAPNTDKCI